MKFDCGPTREEKLEMRKAQYIANQRWHKVFAWTPKRVGSHDCRWLETVERRGVERETYGDYGMGYRYLEWEYRAYES